MTSNPTQQTAPKPTPSSSLETEPFYLPIGDEVDLFLSAYRARLPVLLKGPTGCGKTRFVEAMAYRLFRGSEANDSRQATDHPLTTVSCHEDLTSTDLVGRYLLTNDETVWIDGPLTRAVREGSICYLDEIVEARKDTTVLIHALTDHRRFLPIEKQGDVLSAHPDFLLVISYNPGYQSASKDLKPSTRQRFIAIEFDYPPEDAEAEIIATEAGADPRLARDLAILGSRIRNLQHHGFDEGVSTRLLVYAAQLATSGIPMRRACDVAVVKAVTDDLNVQTAIAELVSTVFA